MAPDGPAPITATRLAGFIFPEPPGETGASDIFQAVEMRLLSSGSLLSSVGIYVVEGEYL